jgi:stage III sporulation protein SpoIIIAA
MLREIARTLSDPDGFFCKSVHLVDSIGELYGNQTEFSKNVKSVSKGLRQHEVIVEPKPYALCVDDICTGEEVESLEHISESGIVLVATVRASSVEDIINSKPTMRGLLGISAKDHSNTTSLMSRRSGICCFASALLLSSSQGARYRFIPNLNATIDDCLVSQTKNRN